MFPLPCCVHFFHLGRLCCNSGIFSWQADMFCSPNKCIIRDSCMKFCKHGEKKKSQTVSYSLREQCFQWWAKVVDHTACSFLPGATIPCVMCVWCIKRQRGHNMPSHTSKARGTLLKRARVSVIMGPVDTAVSSLLLPAILLCTLKTGLSFVVIIILHSPDNKQLPPT